jgi:hypothetical protein
MKFVQNNKTLTDSNAEAQRRKGKSGRASARFVALPGAQRRQKEALGWRPGGSAVISYRDCYDGTE